MGIIHEKQPLALVEYVEAAIKIIVDVAVYVVCQSSDAVVRALVKHAWPNPFCHAEFGGFQ